MKDDLDTLAKRVHHSVMIFNYVTGHPPYNSSYDNTTIEDKKNTLQIIKNVLLSIKNKEVFKIVKFKNTTGYNDFINTLVYMLVKDFLTISQKHYYEVLYIDNNAIEYCVKQYNLYELLLYIYDMSLENSSGNFKLFYYKLNKKPKLIYER